MLVSLNCLAAFLQQRQLSESGLPELGVGGVLVLILIPVLVLVILCGVGALWH